MQVGSEEEGGAASTDGAVADDLLVGGNDGVGGVVGSVGGCLGAGSGGGPLSESQHRSENGLFEPFVHCKTIILPRQARDKHRKSSKRTVFLQSDGRRLC
jgi:hypothetical protein